MALKPWYRVVAPREDLREGKPLDASEFAVHLDQVRDGRAPTDYQRPDRFFDRTEKPSRFMRLGISSIALQHIEPGIRELATAAGRRPAAA